MVANNLHFRSTDEPVWSQTEPMNWWICVYGLLYPYIPDQSTGEIVPNQNSQVLSLQI